MVPKVDNNVRSFVCNVLSNVLQVVRIDPRLCLGVWDYDYFQSCFLAVSVLGLPCVSRPEWLSADTTEYLFHLAPKEGLDYCLYSLPRESDLHAYLSVVQAL